MSGPLDVHGWNSARRREKMRGHRPLDAVIRAAKAEEAATDAADAASKAQAAASTEAAAASRNCAALPVDTGASRAQARRAHVTAAAPTAECAGSDDGAVAPLLVPGAPQAKLGTGGVRTRNFQASVRLFSETGVGERLFPWHDDPSKLRRAQGASTRTRAVDTELRRVRSQKHADDLASLRAVEAAIAAAASPEDGKVRRPLSD